MNEEFTIEPERALQITPVVYHAEVSRAEASFNQSTGPNVRGLRQLSMRTRWATRVAQIGR